MAGGKQTPRQRMINILYLVLLGLIALSIPDSLMDAFKNIKVSLNQSTDNVTKGIQSTYTTFEKTTLKDQHERAQPIYDKAKNASKVAQDLYDYVQRLTDTLIAAGGGINTSINDVSGRENLDISPRVMINQKKGEELKQKIDDTKAKLIAFLDPKDQQQVNFSLNTDPPHQTAGPSKTWEEAYFGDGIPLGATLTTLAKIQTDTKNAENEVIKKILSKAEQAQVNLDQFAAVAVAPTSYVLVGQPYTADVFLTAYDSKMSPQITVDGSPLQVQDGKGKYTGNTGSVGPHTWTATIKVKQTDGSIKDYTTPPQTYMVAAPSATVSPEKMNVLYIGVPNPIAVGAAGVPTKDLHVSISSGSLTPVREGHYEAHVSSLGSATISVSGTVGGKTASLGSMLFRVKRIPDPKAMFAGRSGGNVATANLRAQDRIFANLEGFDFDAKFRVTRFTLVIQRPRSDALTMNANGNELNGQMRQAMSTLPPGSTVIFDEIIAVGPDGTQRGLDPIVLRAN